MIKNIDKISYYLIILIIYLVVAYFVATLGQKLRINNFILFLISILITIKLVPKNPYKDD